MMTAMFIATQIVKVTISLIIYVPFPSALFQQGAITGI
jgi:hypothetical protein